jgi:XTP/dITP diphosphohydrolase
MCFPSTIIIASGNPGKVAELRDLLATWHLADIRSLADFPGAREPVEDGPTYSDNAAIKALSAARHTGLPSLADDSGIEVDALDGRPGLRSARYGGPGLDDDGRVGRLLDELAGVPEAQRTARYRAVVVLAWPDGRTIGAPGACEGRIAVARSGTNGFGYDPVFIYGETGITFGDTRPEDKLHQDHRGRAVRALRYRVQAACAAAGTNFE